MEILRKSTLRSCMALLLALCLLASMPLTTLAATYNTCSVALNTVSTSLHYGEAADAIMALIIDVIQNNEYASSMFKGSSSSSLVQSIAINTIGKELDNNRELVESLGFNLSSDKDKLANELWYAACIYYDNGKNANSIKMGAIELIRFVLVEVDQVSANSAQSLAPDYYDIYQYALANGEAAAKERELANATGHSYGDWQEETQATCKQEGLNRRTCSVCGKSETQTTSATDHSPVTDTAVESTCTETGLTEGSHCSVCGQTITAQETVPVKDHSYTTLQYNDYGHWFTCSCGDKSEVETHIDEDSDSICDVCSYTKESSNAPDGWGDADGDGKISSIDASLVLQYDVKLIDETKLNLAKLDLNGDGNVNSIDASLILQFDVKLITSFPVQNQQ